MVGVVVVGLDVIVLVGEGVRCGVSGAEEDSLIGGEADK